MDMLLGLASLAGLSLFMAWFFKRSSSYMPLVAVCGGMLWFTVWGCAGLLPVGGWLWYLGCAAAVAWLFYKHKNKKDIVKLVTPGLALFVGLGAAFIVLFWATKPMLTQWDEFTFWGTAAKVVGGQWQLYTAAPGNLLANVQPPGLPLLSYMMQFFSFGFAEYKLIAAYAVLYVAAFCAAVGLWGKNRAGAVVGMGCMLLLPLLLEPQNGASSWAYLSALADLPMGALLGGALCLYFAEGRADEKTLLATGVVLAALTNVKDMGFALALLGWFIIGVDLLLCRRKEAAFFGLRKAKAALAGIGAQLGMIALTYGGWALHIKIATQVDRSNIGSGGAQLNQIDMLLAGLGALFRVRPDALFDQRAVQMIYAFLKRSVWLFGSSARLFILVVLVLDLAWFLNPNKAQKRRVLIFGASSLLGFIAYYIFLTFTYTYVFSAVEGGNLASYERYVLPYWIAWLMASLALLWAAVHAAIVADRQAAQSGTKKKATLQTSWRTLGARAVSLGLCAVLLGTVALRGNWQANFMRQSPSLYGSRLDVQAVAQAARAEGMTSDDVVYLISQNDDASRFYLFCYEMESRMVLLYGGTEPGQDGEAGFKRTTAASLIVPNATDNTYLEAVECTPETLAAYLKYAGCTHILVDAADGYIMSDFAPLFTDGLAGWNENGYYEGGRRYYAILWPGDMPVFAPVEGGAA